MKTSIVLKEFSDLSPGAVQITHATASATPESPVQPTQSGETHKDFRELLHQRYTTPFVSAIPYHRWGINE